MYTMYTLVTVFGQLIKWKIARIKVESKDLGRSSDTNVKESYFFNSIFIIQC